MTAPLLAAAPTAAPAPPPGPRRPDLYVAPDPAYHCVRRRLVGWMERPEWDAPSSRLAAIARWWPRAELALRSDDEELVTPAPVTLYRDPGGVVVFADLALPGAKQRQLIRPDGRPLAAAPPAPPCGWLVQRTSYATWAEGPFPYRTGEMERVPTAADDPDVQYIRNKNAALRELVDRALTPANFALGTRRVPDINDRVGFRLRAVCRRRDLPALRSAQSGLLYSTLPED